MLPWFLLLCWQQTVVTPTQSSIPSPATEKVQTAEKAAEQPANAQRTQLNLLGQTDAGSGESRRNENQQFNAMDTNTVKELNLRIGTTATLVPQFRPDASYFGSEFGGPPVVNLKVAPAPPAARPRLQLWYAHNNSAITARSFFQVGDVKPARENDYGFTFATPIAKKITLSFDGRQQRVRGQVNGNVLVPLASERTALATDPQLRSIVERYLAGYPLATPNRTDIDPRMLNTNAPQAINTDSLTNRADMPTSADGRLALSHSLVVQKIRAFQLVAGQNPDTDIRSHTARLQWTRGKGPSTWVYGIGFDRVATWIRPASDSLGPSIMVGNALTGLSPSPPIPILRTTNKFRYAVQHARRAGTHALLFGAEVNRNQVNGIEQDGDRGIIGFTNDFGRDAITNLRMGTPSSFVAALGNNYRGFRNLFVQGYVGDQWRVNSTLQLDYGVRYEIASKPIEVNGVDQMPFGCDCNNVAPRFGFAYRLPGRAGRLRGAYGVHFGEIFATTYGQTRLSPPGSYRIAIPSPDLRNPLNGLTYATLPPGLISGQFLISPEMATPYEHQYNFSWETDLPAGLRLQTGYVGSRAVKLFQMWFENRAQPVVGISQTTATINQRRPDPRKLEVFRLLNSSRGYYDAARVTLLLPRKAGFQGDASYWFSKAIDLGNDYTSTLSGNDARQGRSQGEANVHADLKARTSFDQPHAFLARGSYEVGRGFLRRWTTTAVVLLKNGTPFTVDSGSDGPGFGNVDGQGSDRPNILNTAILHKAFGDPDARIPRDAFAYMAPTALRGTLGRNTFRRGRIANVNASFGRQFLLPHERSLDFRAESINLLNTPQFSEPNKDLASPSFGRIVNTLNEGRTFRFTLRLQL